MKDSGKNLQTELIQSISRLYTARKKLRESQDYLKQVSEKEEPIIASLLRSNGFDSVNVVIGSDCDYGGAIKLKVTKCRTNKIVWKLEQLKRNLSKQTYRKCVNKTYTVNDMDGLISYLKQCNVDPCVFKTFINVTEQVDEKEINQLYEIGEITKKQIKGCYSVLRGKTQIRITEQKHG